MYKYEVLHPKQFQVSYKFEVNFDECDMAGIVHNSNYIKYFERSRTSYIHNLGLKWTLDSMGEDFYVVIKENYCTYITPSFFEEILTCFVKVSKLGRSSMRFEYLIQKENGKNTAAGFSTLVKIDPKTFKPKCLSNKFKKIVENFEQR